MQQPGQHIADKEHHHEHQERAWRDLGITQLKPLTHGGPQLGQIRPARAPDQRGHRHHRQGGCKGCQRRAQRLVGRVIVAPRHQAIQVGIELLQHLKQRNQRQGQSRREQQRTRQFRISDGRCQRAQIANDHDRAAQQLFDARSETVARCRVALKIGVLAHQAPQPDHQEPSAQHQGEIQNRHAGAAVILIAADPLKPIGQPIEQTDCGGGITPLGARRRCRQAHRRQRPVANAKHPRAQPQRSEIKQAHQQQVIGQDLSSQPQNARRVQPLYQQIDAQHRSNHLPQRCQEPPDTARGPPGSAAQPRTKPHDPAATAQDQGQADHAQNDGHRQHAFQFGPLRFGAPG